MSAQGAPRGVRAQLIEAQRGTLQVARRCCSRSQRTREPPGCEQAGELAANVGERMRKFLRGLDFLSSAACSARMPQRCG